MKTRAELKQEAKDTLRGRWGTAIGMILIYSLIVVAISIVSNFIPLVGGIASIVISIPLSFGFIGQMLKFSRNEQVGFFDFFTLGFNNFGKSWGIFGNTLLKLVGWILGCVLSIIFAIIFGAGTIVTGVLSSGSEDITTAVGSLGAMALILFALFYVFYIILIVKSYYYVLTEYIGNDNPDMTAKDVVEKSKEIMTGNRWRFFVLGLSFIGWAILSALTFGIGYLWLAPYMEVTTIKFYEDVAGIDGRSQEMINQ